MTNIDVNKLADEVDKVIAQENRENIEKFISSINGKSFPTQGKLIEEVIAPIIGLSSLSNKKFTIELIQKVINELPDK